MIFWFSGTGNSKHIATQLAELLGEHLVSIAEALASRQLAYRLGKGERIGFVFPTYSWGPPPVVMHFVHQLSIDGVDASTYCYMATTCGDDTGQCAAIMRKALAHVAPMNASFSITMPNTYVCLPGFDVDGELLQREKLSAAQGRIQSVASSIACRRDCEETTPGRFAWLKSRVIRPLFLRHAMSDKPFKANASLCTHCRKCERACPMHNITMDAAVMPVWHHHCAMCLSCLHRCPARAINYGSHTQRKGRYYYIECE